MSKPLKPGKSTVALPSSGPRPSKIRREPPPRPAEKQTVVYDPSDREAWTVAIGVLLFGIAITIIILGFSDYTAG